MPSPAWRVPVFVALGVLAGLGFSVVKFSKALSYLSDKPEIHVQGARRASTFVHVHVQA